MRDADWLPVSWTEGPIIILSVAVEEFLGLDRWNEMFGHKKSEKVIVRATVHMYNTVPFIEAFKKKYAPPILLFASNLCEASMYERSAATNKILQKWQRFYQGYYLNGSDWVRLLKFCGTLNPDNFQCHFRLVLNPPPFGRSAAPLTTVHRPELTSYIVMTFHVVMSSVEIQWMKPQCVFLANEAFLLSYCEKVRSTATISIEMTSLP